MGAKFAERHAPVYRPAVVDNVQVINSKVDDTAPSRILNVAVFDVPFLRDRPVEHLGAGCHLMGLKRDQFAKPEEALPQAISGDAAADREQLADQFDHPGCF